MYMTVLKMDRSSILNAENLLDVNSSNSVHKWLTNQQNTSRSDGQILYKILAQKDEIYMYIQSKDKFNTDNIEKVGLIFIKQFQLTKIQPKQYYMFNLSTFPNFKQNNKHLFINDINKRYNWIQNQFSKNGMVLMDCREVKKSEIILDKDSIKTIPITEYSGKLIITDSIKAQSAIEAGLGRFKNYGLGLILIKSF